MPARDETDPAFDALGARLSRDAYAGDGRSALEEAGRYKQAAAKQNYVIEQTLGKALGYPRFADDQKNFPGATDADGVCVGEHIAETLAEEAAKEIARLREQLARSESAYYGLAQQLEQVRAELAEARETGR